MVNEAVLDNIKKSCELVSEMQSFLKSCSMHYQYDLKIEVAKYLGVSFEKVNVRFDEWVEIRDAYLNRVKSDGR